MKDKDKGKKGIFILLYRLMYTLAIGLALSGQVHRIFTTWMENETEQENVHSGVYQGAVYAVGILLSFLLAYSVACIVTIAKQTKIALCILTLAGSILMMVLGTDPGRLTMAGLLTGAVISAADCLRELLQLKDEYKVVFLFPYFVLLFLLVCFVPISEKPIDWTAIVRVYERIADKGRDLLHRIDWGLPDYSSTKIGFDGRGSLFDKIEGNDKEALYVTGILPNRGATYLAGRVFSDFDGKEWTSDDENTDPGRMLDTLETVSAIYETYPYNTNDVCRYVSNDITVRDIRTEYVFTVPKVILGEKYLKNVSEAGDNILFTEKKRYGYSYRVSGFILNRGGEELAEYKRDISEETFKMTASKYRREGGGVYTYEDLLNYREGIKEIYGKKPQISNELTAYIESIAGPRETAGDYERLKALESWLSSHEYVTDIDIPRNRVSSQEDFLEYFLVENTEGYCSYYATAFVLMARTLDIPARYVQGYRIPEGDSKQVTVTENMAHAWPECYIEGLGWIGFEPTPGFKSLPEWGGKLKSPEYYEDLKNHPADADFLFGEEMNESKETPAPEIDEAELLREQERIRAEQQRKRRIVITTVSIIVGSLVLVIIMMLLIRFIIRDIRFRKLKGRELVAGICMRCFMILEAMDEKPAEGETLTEFSARIGTLFTEEERRFISRYEEILYDKNIPGEDTADTEKTLLNNYGLLRHRLMGRGRQRARIRYFFRAAFSAK